MNHLKPGFRALTAALAAVLVALGNAADAQESGQPNAENASNPLSKARNTDLRYQYFDLTDGSSLHDAFIDGAFMANDKLKIKYELHYSETNVTGSSEHDFDRVQIKPIYFPAEGEYGSIKYRLAVGFDWVVSFDNADKGIGSGSDELSPFAGIALAVRPGTMVIPLVQQFLSYDGPDVNTTALRAIVLQTLPDGQWLKIDGKLPVDWENDNALPATVEAQFGKHLSKSVGVYADGLLGVGADRPYDYGLGVGVRFKY